MKVKIDGKSIVEKHSEFNDRKKVSLYLSESLYEQFKKKCKNAPASKVMEELMLEFIQSFK